MFTILIRDDGYKVFELKNKSIHKCLSKVVKFVIIKYGK
jgi:hypothetical protein